MTLEIKLIAYLAGAILSLGLITYVHHVIYASGERDGEAKIQKAWDDNKADIQRVADEAVAKATKDRDAALAANQGIHDEYEKRLADTTADAALFAQRLRDAATKIAAGSSTLSKVGDLAGSAAASAAGSAQLLGQLLSRLTGLREECVANDAALDALVLEIRPQI